MLDTARSGMPRHDAVHGEGDRAMLVGHRRSGRLSGEPGQPARWKSCWIRGWRAMVDDDLYQGAMEAADIAFRPDGTGWTSADRDGGWSMSCASTGTLQTTAASPSTCTKSYPGSWDLVGHTAQRHAVSQASYDKQLALAYGRSAQGQDVFKRPATLPELDRKISLGRAWEPVRLQTRTSPD